MDSTTTTDGTPLVVGKSDGDRLLTRPEDKLLNSKIKWPSKPTWSRIFLGIYFALLLALPLILAMGPVIIILSPLILLYGKPFRTFFMQFAEIWYKLFIFYQEYIKGQQIEISGVDLKEEGCLFLSNHPSEGDWLFFWSLASHQRTTRWIRIMLKKTLRLVPGLGWAINELRFMFVSRDWKQDRAQIIWQIQNAAKDGHKPCFFMFPEGTDFTPAKLARSNEFATSKLGIEPFKHVLTPKVKGLETVLQTMRPHITAVYDLTIAYEGGVKPTLWSVFTGTFPQKACFHVRRFPIESLPTTSSGINDWTLKLFREKDNLLESFENNGKFETKENEKQPHVLEKSGWDVVGFAIFWLFFLPFATYYAWPFSVPWWITVMQIISWVYFIAVSTSPMFRILLGMDPPQEFVEKLEKSK